MIKAIVLLAALVAVASAGPRCSSLANTDFDSPNTVSPWQTNSYLGGTSTCQYDAALQCELLQMNALNGGSNSGRISVGQRIGTGAECASNPGESVGANVFQSNIGMCRSLVLSVDLGQQDRREVVASRIPTTFSIVVGRDHFDLNGGTHTVVVGTSMTTSDTQLQETSIQGTWEGPHECIDICPQNSCYAVGVRFERNEAINANVRLFMDNFEMTDITAPVITFEGQTVQASSCDGSVTVTLGASATDNCCGSVTITYKYNDLETTNDVATFGIGCHEVTAEAVDASGNSAEATVMVCVMRPNPTISCSGPHRWQTQSCWTPIPDNSVVATPGINCDDQIPSYSPSLSDMYRLGVTTITASFTQGNGLPSPWTATWTASCEIDVEFTMCCVIPQGDKRSIAPFQKLRKF